MPTRFKRRRPASSGYRAKTCCWERDFSAPTARRPHAARGGVLLGLAAVVSLGILRASERLRAVTPYSVSVNVSCSRGPFNSHVNPMRCAWVTLPRRVLRGLRAHQGVNAHVQELACERHSTTDTVVPKTQTTSPTTHRFSPYFSEVVCTLGTTEVQTATSPTPNGGKASLEPRHAGRQLLMLQNPHRHRIGGHRRYLLPCRSAVRPGLPQKSHAIRLAEDSTRYKNVAISTL